MEYYCYNHLFTFFVAHHAITKKNAENPVFIRLLGKNIISSLYFRGFSCILLE